jgi:hypothetical protein
MKPPRPSHAPPRACVAPVCARRSRPLAMGLVVLLGQAAAWAQPAEPTTEPAPAPTPAPEKNKKYNPPPPN